MNFFETLNKNSEIFPIKSIDFLNLFDIDRLHELRIWWNFSAHDIFPAIRDRKLMDKKI